MFNGVFSKAYTNSIGSCPSSISYDNAIQKFTATFNFVCSTGKNLFSNPSAGTIENWQLTIDCAKTPSDLIIYNTQIGDAYRDSQSFAAACFVGSGQSAQQMSQIYTLNQAAMLGNTRIVPNRIFQGFQALCECVSTPHQYSYDGAANEAASQESHDEGSLVTPQNIAIGLGTIALVGLGAYAFYKKLKANSRYTGTNYFDLDQDYNSDQDEDFVPEASNENYQTTNRRITRASEKYSGYDYFNEDPNYDSEQDEDYSSEEDNSLKVVNRR
ncbi:MAG: hypothetical protein U1E78_09565 [Gammaproteobacteria bacterium]